MGFGIQEGDVQITQIAIMSELEDNQPEWHMTMVKTENHLHTAVFGLMGAIQETDDPKLQAYTAETAVALTDLFPVMTDTKNSWSNNFHAKMAWKHKFDVASEVAALLMDGVVVLHGISKKDAYLNMYTLICPRISHRGLKKGDTEVLQKILNQAGGNKIKVEQ